MTVFVTAVVYLRMAAQKLATAQARLNKQLAPTLLLTTLLLKEHHK